MTDQLKKKYFDTPHLSYILYIALEIYVKKYESLFFKNEKLITPQE